MSDIDLDLGNHNRIKDKITIAATLTSISDG